MILVKKWTRLIFFVVLGFTWSCANPGTDTGNPTAIALNFVGTAEINATRFSSLLQVSGLELTEARIVLKEIQLEPLFMDCNFQEPSPEPQTPDTDFTLPGPFVVDLINNSSSPETSAVEVPSGAYCEIELKFDRLESPNIPPEIPLDDPIIGNSLLMRGTRSDGTPFTVSLERDDRFKMEGSLPQGFEIQQSTGVSIFFVSFELAGWFTGVSLEGAEVSADGGIQIDEQNNVALWTPIILNVKQSARLFRDLNGNGILDPEEAQETLALAIGADEED